MVTPLPEMSHRVRLISLFSTVHRGKRGRSYRERVVETARELDAVGELTYFDVFNAAIGGSRLYFREFAGTVLLALMAAAFLTIHVADLSRTDEAHNSQRDVAVVAYWTNARSQGGCHVTAGPSKMLLTVLVDPSRRPMTFHMAGSCFPSTSKGA